LHDLGPYFRYLNVAKRGKKARRPKCVQRSVGFILERPESASDLIQALVCDEGFSLKAFNLVYKVDSAHWVQGLRQDSDVTANRKLAATSRMTTEQHCNPIRAVNKAKVGYIVCWSAAAGSPFRVMESLACFRSVSYWEG